MERMVGVVCVALLFSACPAPQTCDATSCAQGCCSAAGACETGLSDSACGTGGAACGACAAGSSCRANVCTAPSVDAGCQIPGAEDDGGTTRTVVITRSNRYVSEAGEQLDNSIADAGLALYVDGNFDAMNEIIGARVCDAYVVRDVPRTRYLLRYDKAFLRTNLSAVDLGTVTLGRVDVERFAPDASVSLTLALSGLPVWGADDNLDFFSSGTGLSNFSLDAPTPGAVPTSVTLDYLQLSRPNLFARLDSTRGDSLFVFRRTTVEVGADVLADGGVTPLSCDSVADTALITALTISAGANAAVASFSNMPSRVVTLQYPRDAWRAVASEVYPQAFLRTDTASVLLARPELLSVFNLVSCRNFPPAEGTPLAAISHSFTVPGQGPADWVKKSTVRVTYGARGLWPDGGSTFMTATGGTSGLLGEPLTPGVHAPTAITVQGKPGNNVGTVNAAAPLTVTWVKSTVAPVAERFTVSLEGSGFTAITTEAQFTFPAGVLTAGNEYFVRVEADVMNDPASERRPYAAYRTSFMTAVSNRFIAQ